MVIPQTITQILRQSAIKWPLHISAMLILVWVFLKYKLALFPLRQQEPVFYPLYAIMSSPVLQWVALAALCGIVILLHAITFYKYRLREAVAISLFIQAGMLLFLPHSFTGSAFSTTHRQTLVFDQHAYHLLLTQDRSRIEEIRHYDVLECDPSGVFCQHYATPYMRQARCAAMTGAFEIDPATQRLMLRFDSEIYEVSPTNNGVWQPCPDTLAR